MARSLGRACLMLALLAAAPAAWGQVTENEELENQVRARDDRIVDLERKVDVLVDEIARLRTQVAVPEEAELKSAYGLGPAASKVYGIERGLSLGGYGEAYYSNRLSGGASDTADAYRFVQYVGYKFNESIVLNTEIEFEHGTTGSTPNSSGGSVSVEFMALDFFWKKEANFRTGLVLVPMGFINEVHEPPTFFGVQRPEVETRIIPTTWRELGVGVFGNVGEDVAYRAYVINGFDATGFSSSGIRSGRQKGNRVRAEDLAFVGRVDWTPGEEWLLGASVYTGKGGQDQNGIPGSQLTMFDVHAQWNRGPWHARGLFAMNFLNDAGDLSSALGLASGKPVAEQMLGGYGELAYDVWALLSGNNDKYLAPFARVEYVDTQKRVPNGFSRDGTKRYWVSSLGMNFKPHPNVVLKAEYRNFSVKSGDISDEISLGMGFAF